MTTISNDSPRTQEFVTEILDESKWSDALQSVIAVLKAKGVGSVKAEFGFVLERDMRGEEQMSDTVVPLESLSSLIERGLDEGAIEWAGNSDFVFSPVGLDLRFMLCNDADLHFSSGNTALLAEVSRALTHCGIKVYDSGRLTSPDTC